MTRLLSNLIAMDIKVLLISNKRPLYVLINNEVFKELLCEGNNMLSLNCNNDRQWKFMGLGVIRTSDIDGFEVVM